MTNFFPLTSADSVKITDGTDELAINADGSIISGDKTSVNAYNAGTGTDITVYTVTGGKTFYMTEIIWCFGGTGNIYLDDSATRKLHLPATANSVMHFKFKTPIPFTTDVRVKSSASNTHYALVNGYEE